MREIAISRRIKVFIIAIIAVGIYANTLSNGFVYDDNALVLENRWITSLKYIPEIFFSSSWGFEEGYGTTYSYRPMMHISYMAEYWLFGTDPRGWHLVNIILHALNSIMVFLIASLLLRNSDIFKIDDKESDYPALIAALLFATHPVNTESVNWIAAQLELSYTLFYLLSFYLYIVSYRKPVDQSARRKYLYPLSILSFFVALLYKEPALTLLIVLVVHDLTYRQGRKGLSMKRYLPFLVVEAFYMFLRLYSMGGVLPYPLLRRESIPYLPNVCLIIIQYLKMLFIPVNLSVFHIYDPVESFFETKVIVALLAITGIIYMVWRLYRIRGDVLIYTSFIFLPLLPSFFMLFIDTDIRSATPVAERYLYLPVAGFSMLLSLGISYLWQRLDNRRLATLLSIPVGIYIAGLATMTFKRNPVWRDDYTLWKRTVETSPENYYAHFALGEVYMERGERERAVKEFIRAEELNPRFTGSHHKLGLLYYSMGLKDKAEEEFREVVRIYPESGDAHYNLGIIYIDTNRLEEAIRELNIALRYVKRKDRVLRIRNALAVSYAEMGDKAEARRQLLKAFEVDSSDRETLNNLSALTHSD